MTPLTHQLAAALRHMPCTCIAVGSWPLFKDGAKAHQPKRCARCAVLEQYDRAVAEEEIVQTVEGEKERVRGRDG